MKQTAVEYLLKELRIEDLAKGEHLSVVLDICEKAKEMEKEQLKRAYYFGIDEEYHYTSRKEMFDNFYKTIFESIDTP